MDKNKHFMWEANDDVPTALALVAVICLWGFVASAATNTRPRLDTGFRIGWPSAGGAERQGPGEGSCLAQ